MNDWMLMIASAAAASLIAYNGLSAKPSEAQVQAAPAATAPQVAAPPSMPEAVAGTGAKDQVVGATGQADLPHDR